VQKQVAHLVFFKISMSTGHKMSALGLLGHSVRRLRFSYSFLQFFSHGSENVCPLELDGVTFVVNYVKCVSLPVVTQNDPPPLNGS